jgi:hypothetical protein
MEKESEGKGRLSPPWQSIGSGGEDPYRERNCAIGKELGLSVTSLLASCREGAEDREAWQWLSRASGDDAKNFLRASHRI